MAERDNGRDLPVRIAVAVAVNELVEAKTIPSPDHHVTTMGRLVELLAKRPGAITALREISGRV